MLARSSDTYKYYLPSPCVTYLDDACLPELVFLYVRSFRITEISLVCPNSSHKKVSIKIKTKINRMGAK